MERTLENTTAQHLIADFAAVDRIYNKSFDPKCGTRNLHLLTKREACAEFLNLPLEHPLVDLYYLMHEYRAGQPDAIQHRLTQEKARK